MGPILALLVLAAFVLAYANGANILLANSVASMLVIGASLLGSPVSTTHVSTGALFGIGAWSDRTDWRMVGASYSPGSGHCRLPPGSPR
jgi:phosphate/sulfate permease